MMQPVNLYGHRLAGWALIGVLVCLLFAHPGLYARTDAFAWLLAAVGLLWLLLLVRQRRTWRQFLPGPLVIWPVTVFALSAGFSLLLNPEASWHGLWLLGAQLLLLWVGWWLATTPETVRLLGRGIALAAGGASIYAWLQYFQLDPLPVGTPFGHYRVVSFFENPNYLGNFLACCLPLLMAAFLRVASKHPVPTPAVRLRLVVLYALLALTYGGLLMSASRGAWIASLAGALVIGLGFLRELVTRRALLRPVPLLVLALLLGGITLFIAQRPLVREPHKQLSMSERALSSRHIIRPYETLDSARTAARGDSLLVRDDAINHRHFIWSITWEMIRSHPFFGMGYGNYQNSFVAFRNTHRKDPRFQTLNWVARSEATLYAHNEYLHIWAENGILGLFSFLGLIFLGVVQALRGIWRSGTEALYAWGGLGLIVVMLIHSLVSYPLRLPLNGFVFWILFGIIFNWQTWSKKD